LTYKQGKFKRNLIVFWLKAGNKKEAGSYPCLQTGPPLTAWVLSMLLCSKKSMQADIEPII